LMNNAPGHIAVIFSRLHEPRPQPERGATMPVMIRSLTVFLFTALIAFGQTRKEFEVASIRPVGDQPAGAAAAGLHIDGAQIRISNLALKDYLAIAYRVRINQISGPDWLASQRFDITAKLPDGGVPGDVNEMLESLLVDRFQMKAHREMKELPVYALEVAKTGLKVTATTPDEDPSARNNGVVNVAAGGTSAGVMINLGEGSYFMLDSNSVQTQKLSMRTLADMLTRFLDRPVVDMTELKGGYDLKFDLSPEDRMAMLIRSAVAAGVVLPPQALALLDGGSGDSLFQSMKKIGLSVEARKAALGVIVIDEMRKTPTEN